MFPGVLISFWQLQGRRCCSSVLTCTVEVWLHVVHVGWERDSWLKQWAAFLQKILLILWKCANEHSTEWKCVFSFSLCTSEWKKKSLTVLIQILSSHPVQEFKFSWVCFFFWFFFCFSSLLLPFSFPSACFSLRCWRFLLLLRSCTIRSCKAS